MKKRIYLSSFLLIFILVFFYFMFRKSDFMELKCYKEHEHDKNHVKRIYLVKSLPWSVDIFENDLMNELKSINKIDSSCLENIYFVKEVDHNIVNRFIWGDNEQYEDCTAEVNNIDFLANVHFFKTTNGKDTFSVRIYSGPLYHY